MNPYDKADRGRLSRAVELSFTQLKPARNLVTRLATEYAGASSNPEEYGQVYGAEEQYANLTQQMVDAYVMNLAANRPRIMLTSMNPQLRGFAKHYERAVNSLIFEINLEETLRQSVKSAAFCMGIVKVQMAQSVPVEVEQGFWMDPGKPYASNVSLQNFVYDMFSPEWHMAKFAGDIYRLPFADLKKSDVFDQGVVTRLNPTSKRTLESSEPRLEEITRGRDTDDDEYEPHIDLMDLYLPREGKIYTFAVAVNAGSLTLRDEPVAELDWEGVEQGPYNLLAFSPIPENILPSSPVAQVWPLVRLVNSLFRKSAEKARGQKDITAYSSTGADDARRLRNADDQDMVRVDNVSEVAQIKMNGVDPANQAFTLQAIELHDRMAGNLSQMLGLGPSAETVGQEKIIKESASKREAQMQAKTVEHALGIIKSLGHLLWEDQAKTIPGQVEVSGYTEDSTWSPQDREGRISDYNWEVDLFSMPYQSPTQKVQMLDRLVTQLYLPMMPLMQQQGKYIDMEAITAIHADLLRLPRLNDVIKDIAPVEPEAQGGRQQGPGNTSREYIRRSVPTGGTQQSRSTVQQGQWMDQAGQANPDQVASQMRPAGVG